MANSLEGVQLGDNFFKPQFGNVKKIAPTVLTKDLIEIKKIATQNKQRVKELEVKRSEATTPVAEQNKPTETTPLAEQNTPTEVSQPSFYEKNKNMIFIGAGIGAVVIIGAVVYFKTKKKK